MTEGAHITSNPIMAKKETMSAMVSPELQDALSRVAKARGESRLAFVERLLQNGVIEAKKDLKLFENPLFQAFGLAVAKLPGVMEFASKMAGENMSKDEMAELRALIQEQIDRDKDQSRTKVQDAINHKGEIELA